MKFKTTKKEIMNGFPRVIRVGYCNLQHMLYLENPVAYTCGGDGWHADIYDVGAGTAICTGYQPFGNITPSYQTQSEFDNKGEEIARRYNRGDISYEQCKSSLKELVRDFVGTVIGENEGGI